VISHQRVWRWQLPSLVTQQPSKKCSRELLNNSLPCLEERPSYIGTLVKVLFSINQSRYGRNGIHWSWIKHERFGLWVSIISRCHRWRRRRIRRGRRIMII
jgi:hypothetical protein